MNKIFFIAFIIFSSMSSAQSSPVLKKVVHQKETVVQNPGEIDEIRSEYKRINASKLAAEKYKFGPLDCLEEGEITYFLEGKNIVKIIEKVISGDGYSITEYYYKNNHFIFAYSVISGGPASGPDTTTKRRYYSKNGKALRQMEDEKIVEIDNNFDEILRLSKDLVGLRVTKNYKKIFCE